MKTLIIDIDGTVAQYDFSVLLKKYFGVSLPNDMIMCYSIEECLGVTEAEVRAMFKKECYAPANMIPGARTALERFMAKDYEVDILSHRLNFMSQMELEDWLGQNNIPFSSVITFNSLPSYAHAAIDDSPTKLLRIGTNTTVGKLILYEQPWNCRCHDIKNKFTWVKNWQQVVEEVNGN